MLAPFAVGALSVASMLSVFAALEGVVQTPQTGGAMLPWKVREWEIIIRPDGTAMITEPGVWHQEFLCDPEMANDSVNDCGCED